MVRLGHKLNYIITLIIFLVVNLSILGIDHIKGIIFVTVFVIIIIIIALLLGKDYRR